MSRQNVACLVVVSCLAILAWSSGLFEHRHYEYGTKDVAGVFTLDLNGEVLVEFPGESLEHGGSHTGTMLGFFCFGHGTATSGGKVTFEEEQGYGKLVLTVRQKHKFTISDLGETLTCDGKTFLIPEKSEGKPPLHLVAEMDGTIREVK